MVTTNKYHPIHTCIGCHNEVANHYAAYLDCGDYGRIWFCQNQLCLLQLLKAMRAAVSAAREISRSHTEWLEKV